MTPRPPTLVSRVTDRLSREILSGAYRSLDHLPPEPQLTAKYNVSRTVVREATKQLVSRGLAEIHHGRGVKIVRCLHRPLTQSLEFTLPEMRNRLEKLMEVRQLLEPAAARLAAERGKPGHLRAMHECQKGLATATDPAKAAEFDLRFHRALAEAAGNEVFQLMLDSVADLGRASREATISDVGVRRAWGDHELILAAIERRDGAGAQRAMAAHLEGAGKDLRRFFRRKTSSPAA